MLNYHEPGSVLVSKKRPKIKRYWSSILRSWTSLSPEHPRETHKVRKVYPWLMICYVGQDLLWVWNCQPKVISLKRSKKILFSKVTLPSLIPHTLRHGVNNMEQNQLLNEHIFNSFIGFKDTLDKINIFSTMCDKFL